MSRYLTHVALFAALTGISAAPIPAPVAPHYVPKFEAVAETKLLMEGLAQPNYRSLEELLKKKPAEDEAWTFARGQALLLAETGNLLLLRPPRTPEGQDAWFRRATNLREAAAALARSVGSKEYARSRAGLADVANSCNRCHQTFRVAIRVGQASPDKARP